VISAINESAVDVKRQCKSSLAEEENALEEETCGVKLRTTLLVDYMGGIDKRTEGLVIDGDEFFDTEEPLVESDDEASSEGSLLLLGPISPEK
jgi:hypothetical protein